MLLKVTSLTLLLRLVQPFGRGLPAYVVLFVFALLPCRTTTSRASSRSLSRTLLFAPRFLPEVCALHFPRFLVLPTRGVVILTSFFEFLGAIWYFVTVLMMFPAGVRKIPGGFTFW